MGKVFGVTPLELRPGVDEQEFIKFFAEQYAPLGARLGWKGYVLKADRGERDGKLVAIWDMASVEQRDLFAPCPRPGQRGRAAVVSPQFDELNKKLDTFVTGWPYTDYIVQGE